ncbi:MAG: hypothetical protein AB7K04_11315 [Pseudorhodoplanes sp.]
MNLTIGNVRIVPYGVERWTTAGMSVQEISSDGVTIACGFPYAAISSMTNGLRLNTAAIDMPFTGKDDFAAISDWTIDRCGVWDRTARRTLALYFRAVEDAVEASRDVLTEKLSRYEGLFTHADFRFSAPLPLPRAHLFAPIEGMCEGATDDFVRVDLAFFPGGGRTVACLSRTASFGSPKQNRITRLKAVGIEIAWLEDLSAADAFGAILSPMSGVSFFDGETMPCGLLRRPPAV